MSKPRHRAAIRKLLSLAVATLVSVTVAVVVQPAQALAAPGATFTNPAVNVPNSGDPTLTYYNGFYYYVATTWSSDVVMRRARTISALKGAPEQIVVRTGGTTMWAPHLEMINNRWYLYYSVDQAGGERRTHVAESAGTDPLGPYTIRGILNLMPNNGWAIDAAVLKLNGSNYLMFSAFAGDGLQSLYISPLTNPWTAGAYGTRISAPTLSWETQNGAVNEGAFALQRNGRTFITYSASHCNGPNYKLGMLEYRGGNPLAIASWTKFASPIFQRNDANGVFGPGHHSFFTSPDGTETWIAYHANSSSTQGCGTTRSTRVQKISWNADGTPNLGVPVALTTVLPGPSGETASTPVEIRNRHSNLCLDDYNYVTTPGAEVRQWTCSAATVQDWYLTPLDNGYYQISNRHSGLCLDDYNFVTTPGAEVRQWTCNGQAVQQWQINTSGGWSTLVNRHSGLCLDDYNFATNPGAEVRQWTCNGATVQQWSIV